MLDILTDGPMEEPTAANSPRTISSVQSLVLELPPSCIEFCPAHPEYLVIGTYSLETAESQSTDQVSEDDSFDSQAVHRSQERRGTLLVYHLIGRRL